MGPQQLWTTRPALPLILCLPDMVAQALELSRKPHVVIATPGRLADHLRSSNTFSIKKIRFLVSSPRPCRLQELGSEPPVPASESGAPCHPFRKRMFLRLSSKMLGTVTRTIQGPKRGGPVLAMLFGGRALLRLGGGAGLPWKEGTPGPRIHVHASQRMAKTWGHGRHPHPCPHWHGR